MTTKKSITAKDVATAKRGATAKKSHTTNGVKTMKKSNRDDIRAVKYYLGANGEIVREVLNYPEPKRLSSFGKWMKAHPKGILKIIDMKAVLK